MDSTFSPHHGQSLATAPVQTARRPGSILPGLAVAVCVAAFAYALDASPLQNSLPAVGASSVAIVLGLIVGNALSSHRTLLCPGVSWCTKVVLPAGIVLLGARLTASDLVRVGATGVLLSAACIATCLAVAFMASRLLRLPTRLATLMAVGTAICGGSAIAAAAPVIEADDEEVTFSVTAVVLIGLVLMFALPLLGGALDLDPSLFGAWAGLSIQQTPQVVAAGLAYGGEAGEVATLVKLVRVTLLVPVLLLLILVRRRLGNHVGSDYPSKLQLIPGFVFGFLAMAAASSLGWLDAGVPLPVGGEAETSLKELARNGDRIALTLAMGAMGLATRFDSFRREALRPLLVGACAAFFLALFALGAVLLMAGALGQLAVV